MSDAAIEAALQPSSVRGDAQMAVRLGRYLTQDRLRFFGAVLMYPLNALCVVLPPYLIARIFDRAIAQHDAVALRWLCAAYLGSLIFEYISGFASEYAMSVVGQEAMTRLRRDMFAHVQALPTAYFDKNPIGRILTRLTSDVEALGDIFASGAISIVSDILTVVAVVSAMLFLNVRLTCFAFLVVPPLVAIAAFFQRFARQAFRAIRKHIARINTFLAEHISGMSVVQIFGQEGRTQKEFDQLNSDYRDANRQAIFFDAALYSVVEAIGTSAAAALIWYGAADMAHGHVQAGVLVAFIQYIRRFFVPIRDLSTKYTVLQSAFAAAERVVSLLNEPRFYPVEGKASAPFAQAIELRDVWFAYRDPPGERDWILRGINLLVRRGERVALVGATGSGKSTILKLLNRFYDPQRGHVLVDGTDVRDFELHGLRRQFAVVLQDVHLFSGSLMENLAFSDRITPEAAKKSMEAVGGDVLLSRLPNGYDSPVAEMGGNFSAGERQLISLARALALNPEILILDEATSNIDSETEARIQGALEILLQGRTAVIVAHRLSTIQKADRIIVLRQGEVAQVGTHAQLMEQGGIYKTLVMSLATAPT